MSRAALALGMSLLALAGCGDSSLHTLAPVVHPPAPLSPPTAPKLAPFTALSVNVGNVNPHCTDQVFKLCLTPVEQRIAQQLAVHSADVIGLTEVLPPERCDPADASRRNPNNTCSQPQTPPQVMRLVGAGYAVACADAITWDCLAVKTSVGRIAGCTTPPEGGYCGAMLPTRPVEAGCDAGFQVFSATVHLRDAPLFVIVAHPNSGNVPCRTAAIADFFTLPPAGASTLVLGDMNLDPYNRSDASIDLWNTFVGEQRETGKPYAYLSGRIENDPPYVTQVTTENTQLDPTGTQTVTVPMTMPNAVVGVLDHVIASRDLTGRCSTLGEAPGTVRLDGGGGMDHRALLCQVQPAP